MEQAEFILQMLNYLVLPAMIWLGRIYMSMRADIDKLRDQLFEVKSELKHMPSTESMHKLEIAFTELTTKFESLARTTKRIEDYLTRSGNTKT